MTVFDVQVSALRGLGRGWATVGGATERMVIAIMTREALLLGFSDAVLQQAIKDLRDEGVLPSCQ